METRKKGSGFAFAAAAILGIYLIFRGISAVQTLIHVFQAIGEEAFTNVQILLSFAMVIFILALVITLLCRTRIGVLIAMSGCLLVQIGFSSRGFNVWGLFTILAYAAMVVLLILSLAKVRAVKYLWFLPAVFYFIYMIKILIDWNRNGYFSDMTLTFGLSMVRSLIMMSTMAAGLLFTGLWLMKALPDRGGAAAPYAPPPAPAPRETIAEKYAGGSKNYAGSARPPAPPAFAFCGRCGGKNTAANAYCRYCGAPLGRQS